MSKGGWRLYTALGISVAIVVLGDLGSSNQNRQNYPPNNKNTTEKSYNHTSIETPFIISINESVGGTDSTTEKSEAPAYEEGFWRISYKAWIAIFTGILTFATIVLGAATIGLYLATRRLARGAEQQSEDFQESLWHLKAQADATARLARSTRITADHTSKSLALARQDFVATNRPKVIIRYIKPNLSEGVNNEYPIEFGFVNTGGSDAKIIQIRSVIINGSGPWNYGSRDIRFDDPKAVNIILQPGTLHKSATKAKFPFPAQDSNWFVVGDIRYVDRNGIKRQTGFVRRYNAKTKNWDKYESEEWEYVD